MRKSSDAEHVAVTVKPNISQLNHDAPEVGPSRGALRRMRKRGTVTADGHTYIVGKDNIADPRNSARALGRTTAGRAWAIQTLHPCGEDSPGTVYGLPDRSAEPVVVPAGRLFTNLKRPTLKRTEGTGDTAITQDWSTYDNWSVIIYTFPTVRGLIYAIASPSEQFYHTLPTDMPASDTWTWMTAAGDDPVTASCILWTTIPIIPTGDSKWPAFETMATKFRLNWLGVTTHLNAAAVANQGRVLAGQYLAEYKEGFNAITNVKTWIVDPLFSESDLTQRDPKCYNGAAYLGCYLPLRIANPNVPYTALQESHFQFNRLNDSTDGFADVLDPNWMMGVTIYLGVDKAATIDLKGRIGAEFVVSNKSVWRPFARASPLVDNASLDAVAALSQDMSHAYEAKYNDLGKIVGDIGREVQKLGIPILSDIGGAVGSIGGPLISTIGSLFGL